MQKDQEHNALSKEKLWEVVSPINSTLSESANSKKFTNKWTDNQQYSTVGPRRKECTQSSSIVHSMSAQVQLLCTYYRKGRYWEQMYTREVPRQKHLHGHENELEVSVNVHRSDAVNFRNASSSRLRVRRGYCIFARPGSVNIWQFDMWNKRENPEGN